MRVPEARLDQRAQRLICGNEPGPAGHVHARVDRQLTRRRMTDSRKPKGKSEKQSRPNVRLHGTVVDRVADISTGRPKVCPVDAKVHNRTLEKVQSVLAETWTREWEPASHRSIVCATPRIPFRSLDVSVERLLDASRGRVSGRVDASRPSSSVQSAAMARELWLVP